MRQVCPCLLRATLRTSSAIQGSALALSAGWPAALRCAGRPRTAAAAPRTGRTSEAKEGAWRPARPPEQQHGQFATWPCSLRSILRRMANLFLKQRTWESARPSIHGQVLATWACTAHGLPPTLLAASRSPLLCMCPSQFCRALEGQRCAACIAGSPQRPRSRLQHTPPGCTTLFLAAGSESFSSSETCTACASVMDTLKDS